MLPRFSVLAASALGIGLLPTLCFAQAKPDWIPVGKPVKPQHSTGGPASTVVASPVRSTTALSNIQTSANPAPEDPVLLESDTVEQGDEPGIISAIGNVIARNKGRTVRADRIVYNQNNGVVKAYGNVAVVNPDGSTNFADELTLDDELSTGVAGNFAARFSNGATLAAGAAVTREGDRKFLSQVIYTACPICKDGKTKPSWVVRARRAVQNERAETIAYNDVVFEVKGVPVIYIPYFEHGDPSSGRRSGLLQPKPGEGSRTGYFLEQPYIQVLDDYSDITITPLISQYLNPLMQLDYRRKLYSGNLILGGSFTKEKFFGERGEKFGEEDWRGHVFGNGSFKINQTWNWGFGVETASDDLYLMRYKIAQDPLTRSLVRTQSSRLISQIYVQGQSDRFYVRSLGAVFQDLIPGERRKNVPRVAPLVEGTYRIDVGPLNGTLDLTGSAVSLMRTEGRLDSIRANLGAHWRGNSIIGPGLVIEPSAFTRADYFNYSASNTTDVVPTQLPAETFSRMVGQASVDVRWPFIRPGNRMNLTLEPRVNFTIASDAAEQGRIRVEDVAGYELDSGSLFRTVPGMDLWESGARVSAGLKAGMELVPTSGEAVRGSIFFGRRYRADALSSFTRASNLDREESDWVGDVELSKGSIASLTGRFRFDGDTGLLTRTETNARLKLWRTETNLRYYEFSPRAAATATNGPKRELQGSLIFTINKNVKLFGSVYRDFTSDTNLRSAYGLIYGDECTDFRLFYEEIGTTNRFVEPSHSIRFQIVFKTLGEFSDSPFD